MKAEISGEEHLSVLFMSYMNKKFIITLLVDSCI